MSPLNTDDLHRIFKNLDQNGDGFLSLTELESLLERIGMQSTQDELESVVGKTNLDLLDFVSLYDAIVKQKIGGESQDGEDDDEELENDLVEAFKVYDKDGDGFISREELERVLTQLGFLNENASQNCETMIDTYDMNSDGVLDFEEFKKMMLVIES
ncbi:probable calcium-binding protein CML44 [Rhododendron vialii]|uniref:probable calcium-binding protein CML44 n=1 Tax=Rhododendron vialii TaxID=182163 RepID=UPI00265D67A9|nr:probable calcium-binding protein CML44 [Rhododendron vialii]